MFDDDYSAQSRARFLSAREPIFCMGTGFDQKSIKDGGGIVTPWNAAPELHELRRFSRIFLCPSKDESPGSQMPRTLSEIDELRTLAIPHIFVPQISPINLPSTLKCLQVTYDEKHQPRRSWSDIQWPQSVTTNILGLFQRTNSGIYAALARLGVTGSSLPRLQFLACEVDGAREVMKAVQTFETLEHVELEILKKLTPWAQIPATVKVVKITLPSAESVLSGIETLTNLRSLEINGARGQLDFSCLLPCPSLREIGILNSRKIINIESLLEHPTLRSVSFLDCGNPFKGTLKERFKARGFERLMIDFA